MTLSAYQIFVTVAECRNLTMAAARLHLTKSAVSHALAKIEDNCRFSLFYRNQKTVELTEAGKRLLPYAYAVLQEDTKFEEQVHSLQGLTSGLVRMGTCSSTCINWIPEIVRTFRDKYPKIELQIRSGANNSQIIQWLRNNEIDIGLGGAEPNSGLVIEPIYKDELLCVTNRDFRPANPDFVTPEDIRNLPLILQEGDYDEEAVMALARLNVEISSYYTAYDDSCLVAMVEGGFGYCVEGKLSLKPLRSKVSVYSFHPPIYRQISLLRNSYDMPSPAAKKMWAHVREYVESYPEYELHLS